MEKSLFNPIFLHNFFGVTNVFYCIFRLWSLNIVPLCVCVFAFFHDFSWLNCKNDTNINTNTDFEKQVSAKI